MVAKQELDTLAVTTWFDEVDRALGDCLDRIERLAPDAAASHAFRNELLFLLRAARADLVTHYIDATYPPGTDAGFGVATRSSASSS